MLLSTGCTADERKVYETMVTKLDDYFKVRRNTILERAKFNKEIRERENRLSNTSQPCMILLNSVDTEPSKKT